MLLNQIADLLSHTFLDIIVLTIWAFANIYALVMLCFKFKKILQIAYFIRTGIKNRWKFLPKPKE